MTSSVQEDAVPARVTSSSNASAIAELYLHHAEYFGRVAFLLTDSNEQAQDIVQDAFARLAGRFHRIRDPMAMRAYVRKTIVNLAINHYRKRETERSYLRSSATMPAPAAYEVDVESRRDIIQALRSLTPRQRAAVVLRYYEDLPEAEIAQLLHCPLGTVKSTLSRALSALRITLDEGEANE
jgi:RNA polymerase sigma-70 factor (sigma-E family)